MLQFEIRLRASVTIHILRCNIPQQVIKSNETTSCILRYSHIETLLVILVPFAITAFWLSNLRAREHATRLGHRLCDKHAFQFLDDTVALSRVSIAQTAYGIKFVRVYGFEYARGGIGRHKGWIMLKGDRLEAYSLGDNEQNPSDKVHEE